MSSFGRRDRLTDIHINHSVSPVDFPDYCCLSLQRYCGTQWQPILRVRDLDSPVDVSELDSWTHSTDLAVQAMSYVFTVLDLQSSEIAADDAVDRTRANRGI